ncbi:hypothetical protein BLM15_08960 [Bosea sp. Tri-49]|nr:hypothetical protein BLM15_08960 [Bosea sp. Tri-49]
MLPHALDHAARGFPVFPCKATADKKAGSKAPHLPGESAPGRHDGGHWLASREPAQIRDWWRRWPDALIGFPTGLRSSCVVVDLDPKEHSAQAMLTALHDWCGGLAHVDGETGEVIEPPISRTQSGGLHLWFTWPDEATLAEISARLTRMGQGFEGVIGNRAGLFRAFLRAGECPAELAHIDVRGEGGYVIAPPSIMSDGKAYEWVIPRGEVLPPLPRRLRGVITGEFIPDAEVAARRAASPSARRYAARDISDERVRLYVERSVRGALATAQRAGDGNRNAAVFWAACRLGEFVRGGQLSSAEAESLLKTHLPAGVSPAEPKILGTIKSGLTNQKTPAFDPASLQARRAA